MKITASERERGAKYVYKKGKKWKIEWNKDSQRNRERERKKNKIYPYPSPKTSSSSEFSFPLSFSLTHSTCILYTSIRERERGGKKRGGRKRANEAKAIQSLSSLQKGAENVKSSRSDKCVFVLRSIHHQGCSRIFFFSPPHTIFRGEEPKEEKKRARHNFRIGFAVDEGDAVILYWMSSHSQHSSNNDTVREIFCVQCDCHESSNK